MTNKFFSKAVFFLLITPVCLGGAFVHGQKLSQIGSKTKVSFKIKNMGFNVTGSFNDINIVGKFDKNNLTDSYFNGTLQVASIDTGNNKRDNHLRSADYFEAEKYPTITLKTTSIRKKSGQKYSLKADLKIKNTSRNITVPATITETNGTLVLTTDFKVNRLDYGVGDSSWVMADDAYITVKFTAKK